MTKKLVCALGVAFAAFAAGAADAAAQTPLTLADATGRALAKNRDVVIEREAEHIADANLERALRRIADAQAIKGLQGITARRLPPRERNRSRAHRSYR